MEIQECLLTENEVIKMIKSFIESKCKFQDLQLIGGAVIDILEFRTPKDYDFINHSPQIINEFILNGFKYQYETKSSITFKKDNITVQFLHTLIHNFDFKISQANFSFKTNKLEIDSLSFTEKILIPLDFENKRNVLNSLRRLPHWRKKGYSINDLTYLSLLNTLAKYTPLNS
jgi:hypothetical protein